MLVFPEGIYPTQCDWRLVSRSKVFKNPYNSKVQTLSLPGTFWHARLTFANLTRDKGQVMFAFVAEMQGMAGRVKLHDHAFVNPAYASAPYVVGAGQVGRSLNIAGCAQGPFLPSGAYLQIGEQLVVLTQAAAAGANGLCTLKFQPALRASPANGLPIIFNKPQATMMFINDEQGMRRSSKTRVLSEFSLEFVEDVFA